MVDRFGDFFEAYPVRCSPELPSWVRDFTHLPPVGFRQAVAKPSIISAILDGVLHMNGVEIDHISQIIELCGDSDDEWTLLDKLAHLEQLFESSKPRASSTLSLLDSSKGILKWVARVAWTDETIGEFIIDFFVDKLFGSLMELVVALFDQISKAVPPTESILQKMSPSEATRILDESLHAHAL